MLFQFKWFWNEALGINPGIKAFIYNTYCLPKCTYGMCIFSLKKKTIKSINVSQNNLFRYAFNQKQGKERKPKEKMN